MIFILKYKTSFKISKWKKKMLKLEHWHKLHIDMKLVLSHQQRLEKKNVKQNVKMKNYDLQNQ
jgi:hypothetical protein